jgi:hypothetical protein
MDKYCCYHADQILLNPFVNLRLTPFGVAATAGTDDRMTWQLTPFPKIINIMVPKNSAIGSRIYWLREVQIPDVRDIQKPHRNFAHLFG